MKRKYAIRDKLSKMYYTSAAHAVDGWSPKIEDARLYNTESSVKQIISNKSNWLHVRWVSRHQTVDTDPEMVAVGITIEVIP